MRMPIGLIVRSRIVRAPAAVALLACCLLLAGCASAVHVRSLTSAGVSYTDAVDNLLVTTATVAADADSARLLSEGRGPGVTNDDRSQFLERHGRIVTEGIAALEKVRTHVKVLGRYFELLRDLSGGGDSDVLREGVLEVEQSLEALAKELGSSPLLEAPEREAVGRLVSRGAELYGALRASRELRERAPMIERQLLIHRELLVALRKKVRADQRSLATLRYARAVEAPFVAGKIPDELSWIEARRTHFLEDAGSDALERASRAASRLASAWRAFEENRFDEDVRRDALRAAEAAVDIAEAIHEGR